MKIAIDLIFLFLALREKNTEIFYCILFYLFKNYSQMLSNFYHYKFNYQSTFLKEKKSIKNGRFYLSHN